MPTSVASAPLNRTAAGGLSAKKPAPKRASMGAANGVQAPAPQPSPYGIMASRIANRVAEMAENITFIERTKASPPSAQGAAARKPPRKLEMRLNGPTNQNMSNVTFSAPFLDNVLQKMLDLQNRMLRVSQEIAAASEGVDESVKQEQFNQAAELSRIIALICAEKARQGS